MGRPIVVLLGRTTADEDRELARHGWGDLSRVVVPLSPLVDSLTRVTGAVLSRLGKRSDHAPMGRREADEAALLHDWLVADGVASVTFQGADRLPADALAPVADVVAAAGATAVFTVGSVGAARRLLRVLRVRPVRRRASEVPALLAGLQRDATPMAPAAVEPLVLADPHARPPNPEWAAAVRSAQAIIRSAPSVEGRLAAYGEARRKLVGEGWELALNQRNLLEDPSRWRATWVPRHYDFLELHEWRGTDQVCATLLAGLDVSLVEMEHLPGRLIPGDGSAIPVGGDVLPVPEDLRPFLLARRATLEREDRLDDPILSEPRRRPYRGEIRTMVSAVIGHPVVRRDIPLRVDPFRRWLRRHGLEIVSIVPRGAAAVLHTRPGRAEASHTFRTFHSVWPGDRRQRT